MSELQGILRREVAKLLEEGTVDLFVGYVDADLPLKTSVRFLRSPEEAEALVWNASCTSNPAALLPPLFRRPEGLRGEWTPPRVGILAKGCVSRSVVGLINARQVPRDSLYILGIGCDGVIDRHRVMQRLGVAELAEASVEDGNVTVRATDGTAQTLELVEALYAGCRVCRHHAAVIADATIGGEPAPSDDETRYADVEAFSERSSEERWMAFMEEISRCVRCYACREACPNCYCNECFADETAPKWIGVTTDPADLAFFHIGRAYHQAGRCVDCGACVAACPQGIDLRLLNQKVNQDVAVLFGGEASVSLEEPEPLCQFAMEDDQGFMTEP